MLLLLIILAASLVSSAPFPEEEGSTLSLDTNPGRPQVTPVLQAHSNTPYLNEDSLKQDFQGMSRVPPKDNLEKEVIQRKQAWENAIRKEKNKLHPDQVLPIEQDALTRSRCNALPFLQNVFRKNCIPQQIPNRFCFGQCNSFYVPGWPSGLSQPCASCAPALSRRVHVPLRCRGGRVSWAEVVLVEECDCETRYDQENSPVGSGDGFLPVY